MASDDEPRAASLITPTQEVVRMVMPTSADQFDGERAASQGGMLLGVTDLGRGGGILLGGGVASSGDEPSGVMCA